MALGNEEAGGRMRMLTLLLLLMAAGAMGQETFPVEHQRAFWWDKAGVLTVDGEGIRFVPEAKKPEDAKPVHLVWGEIQQAMLAEGRIEIVTYRDVVWQFGRDKQFRFALPEGASLPAGTTASFAGLEEVLRRGLGDRLVVALGAPDGARAEWEIPAKRTGLVRGAEGVLSFTGEELIFTSAKREASRRWPLRTIDTVSQTGPYDFTVTAAERALSDMGGRRSFSFQLKQPLDGARYRALWRAVERAHGTVLRFSDSQ